MLFTIGYDGLPADEVARTEANNDRLAITDPVNRRLNVLMWMWSHYQEPGDTEMGQEMRRHITNCEMRINRFESFVDCVSMNRRQSEIKCRGSGGKLTVGPGPGVATVFRKTVDYPDELAHGFHVTLDDGMWVTVRRDRDSRGSMGDHHWQDKTYTDQQDKNTNAE